MRLSGKSHQQLETFFREYFNDDKLQLPDVEVYGRGVAGIITKALKISAHRFTKSAKEKIEKAGGSITEITKEVATVAA